MGNFLRENLIWILAPIVIVVLAVIAIVFFSGNDAAAPFEYNVF